MILLWLLLIPYTTAAFGIHGGEGITGVNRQVRNALCALPFGLVALVSFGLTPAGFMFISAYLGSNMGFNNWPLGLKGFVTFPPLGAVLLPFSYSIRTKWTNVFSEYFSGFVYGIVLAAFVMVKEYVSR